MIAISQYAKARSAGFVIIPQNGQELATSDGTNTGAAMASYLNAIDGQGREDLFYGYDSDDTATPLLITSSFSSVLDIEKANGKKILVIDYASTPSNVSNSYAQNSAKGYISIAQLRGLNSIPGAPAPYNANGATDINALASANNFLYLINYFPDYATRSDVLSAIEDTDYDVVIMDAFFSDNTPFTASEINSLKTKAGGGRRLVISYMSIGEAEDYRFYWQPFWETGDPCWLDFENPKWAGNYKVHYWDPAWQSYIFGNSNAYLDQILEADFDGAYLDIIDAFQYFENGGENHCVASVSSSLVVHIPILTYDNSNYWADLQYNSNDSTLTLTGAGAVSDVSFYGNCMASTLSPDFILHVPALLLGYDSYWIDLQYGNSGFVIKGFGQN
ncbi:MAG: endo alpha-1,4 polygalactosaminidase [Nitrospirae bacterium]|nr:endo alpha-1,4 polygalactosaminidase [Nitrospirota bacterium]